MTDHLDNIECAAVGAPVPAYDGSTAKAVTRKRAPAGQFNGTRARKFKDIIAMLRAGGVNRAEVAEALTIEPHEASALLAQLGRAGVTIPTVNPGVYFGSRVTHRLSDDQGAIHTFIARLDAPRTPRSVRSQQDDGRDPLALPASFFHPPQADAEPLTWAMPVIPPKPAGFPVPSSYRFELEVV